MAEPWQLACLLSSTAEIVVGNRRFQSAEADYPFVPVAGDGVHEIAVGRFTPA